VELTRTSSQSQVRRGTFDAAWAAAGRVQDPGSETGTAQTARRWLRTAPRGRPGPVHLQSVL